MRRVICALLLALTLPATALAVSSDELLAQLASIRAQILALQAQTGATSAASRCDLLSHTLKRVVSGADVTRLQQFLARDATIYPEGTVSGYFGFLTELAVQRWQIKNSIVFSGTADTTGFGAVGPRTLAAMNTAWCIIAGMTPSPFTPGPGSYLPTSGAVTGAPVTPPTPHIMFTAPNASTTVYKGDALLISWKTDVVPPGATVSLSLQSKDGTSVGILKTGLSPNGNYYWTIPAPPAPVVTSSSDCSDPISCLNTIAQTTTPGCTSLCSVANGLYVLYAQLVSGTKELAHAQSRILSLGGTAFSAADIANTGTTWDSTVWNNASSSFWQNYQNVYGTTTAGGVSAQMCMYSGIPYTEGITVEINCADVTTAGQSCGSLGGMKLTCKSGRWLDQNGNVANVRNVTNTGGAGSCITPWNALVVSNGNEVPQFPFFTNGVYPTNAGAPLIMKCSSGHWQTCDTVGDHCG